VAARLNARPRKTLEYQTPAAMLAAIVASTP
jgi:IS30 family transposase